MKQKRDISMLYAAVAGFLLFVAIIAAITYITDVCGSWHTSTDFDRYFSFPEGTQYEHTDTHGGFHGDGVTTIIAQIPPEAEQEFVQRLREKGFTDAQMPEELQDKVRGDPETNMAADIPNCLWWFEDESPEGTTEGWITNYTLHLYDSDTGTYYYIEYDT